MVGVLAHAPIWSSIHSQGQAVTTLVVSSDAICLWSSVSFYVRHDCCGGAMHLVGDASTVEEARGAEYHCGRSEIVVKRYVLRHSANPDACANRGRFLQGPFMFRSPGVVARRRPGVQGLGEHWRIPAIVLEPRVQAARFVLLPLLQERAVVVRHH